MLTRESPNSKPDPAAEAQAKLRAKATHALVEAAARGALRDEKPPPDLLTAGFPFTPSFWNIVIEPLEPRDTSDGGVFVVDLSKEAEEFQMTVGRVLKCGPTAMQGTTTSGIKLSDFVPGITDIAQLLGKYVVYQRHVGQDLVLRKTGQTVKVMHLTNVIGVTEDPYAWKFYI